VIVFADYDRLPDKTGYRLAGIKETVSDGVTLRSNVVTRINGVRVYVWPYHVDGAWAPDWVRVVE